MNLTALTSEVQTAIGNTNTTIASNITTWLNWSVLQMARLYDWADLVSLNTASYTTTTGTATVSLATTVKKIYDVRYVDTTDDSNCSQLIYRPTIVADSRTPYPPGDAQGVPYYYWVLGKTIYLYPIPDASKSLYITLHSWPTAMSAGTSSPSITNADDAIVAGAIARAYKSLPQLDGADLIKVWDAEFANLTIQANFMDQKLNGWRPRLQPFNALGGNSSLDPTANPFNTRGNYA